MSTQRKKRRRVSLWRAQLYMYQFHAGRRLCTLPHHVERALWSPALRYWVPDDPSDCLPRGVGEGEREAQRATAAEAPYAGLQRDWAKL
jgi:hypothetical protein